MREMAAKAEAAGRRAERSKTFDRAVRAGMVVYGIVHLVFAWLALQLALGDRSGEASSTGALQELARQPLGEVVLWLVAIGMALLTLWRLVEAALAHHEEDGLTLWRKRVTDLGMAVIFGVLSYSAVSIVMGASSGSSDDSSQTLTARVLELPAGQLLVAGIGLGVIGVGIGQVVRGITASFMDNLDGDGRSGRSSRAYRTFGRVGYGAKGLTIGVVGVLFVVSAVQHDPDESGGTDRALRQLLDQPFGPYLLGAMALGIGAYGLFCFARARHMSR